MPHPLRRRLTIVLAAIFAAITLFSLFETVSPSGSDRGGIRLWYLAWSLYFLGVSGLLFFSSRRGSRFFGWLVVLISLTYGPLVVANYIAEAQKDRDTVTAYMRGTGHEFDNRHPFQVVLDLRRTQPENLAYPSVVPEFYYGGLQLPDAQVLPLAGVSNAPTVFCNESGQYAVYQADRFGFNNSDTAWDTPGRLTAVLIGDSFAQGACVPEGQDIAARVREVYPHTVTLGMSGAGPFTELAQLREFLSEGSAQFVF